jgi:hypothetical protein
MNKPIGLAQPKSKPKPFGRSFYYWTFEYDGVRYTAPRTDYPAGTRWGKLGLDLLTGTILLETDKEFKDE